MSGITTYYYEQLNKEQKKVYYAMKAGLTALEPSFPVPRLSAKELSDIYFMLRLDHPEIFYTVQFSYRSYPDSAAVEMIPEYMFAKNKIKEHQQAMTSRIKKLANAAQKLDEKGKEQFIHDFICRNVKYDKLKKPYSHEIIGALGHGVGVCEGIAKTVKILCDNLNIWCIIAISEANPEKGIKYRHAWNIIRIGGTYYHLDATFDNTLSRSEMIRYDYYNISDSQLFRDHEPVIWKMPACSDGSHSWYKEKKMTFTKQEEVRKRAAQAAKKGKVLLFQWRGGYLTRDVLDEFLKIFEEEALNRQKHAYLSLNWPQAVMQVGFEEKMGEAQMVLEEANEGE
ncbi:MAG: peptidase [Clostridia bacterium]|nr:peptidase [Clostridia bacterium]NCC42552.1 peptidase [Clostridia bacterium]